MDGQDGDERNIHEAAIRATVERVYRDESRRVLATLIRLIGDFDLAEEALHEAFAAAVARALTPRSRSLPIRSTVPAAMPAISTMQRWKTTACD